MRALGISWMDVCDWALFALIAVLGAREVWSVSAATALFLVGMTVLYIVTDVAYSIAKATIELLEDKT